MHAVVVLAGLLLAGFERRMGEKGGEGIELLLAFVGEGDKVLVRGGGKLFQVLRPGLRAVRALPLVVREESAALDRHAHLLAGSQSARLRLEIVDERDEALERDGGAAAEVSGGNELPRRRPQ